MKRRINRVYRALIVLLALALSLAVAGDSLPKACAQSLNRAGLVVRFGDDSLITRCVEFGEPEISGYDLLMRSGLNVVAAYFSGQGAAICKIEHEGCPADECLTCAASNYWSYWHLVDGAWVYSQAGASGYAVHNGGVEGWSWGAGDPPSVVPFDQICAPPPTDTPLPPTDTPPPSTDTPVPPTATSPPAAPTATSPPPTPVVWFRLDDNPISAGACTNVRWDTSNAQEVYLDEESVSANGSREVCPTASQEYYLRVVSAAGEETHTLALGVSGTAPATSSPELAASVTLSPTPVPQPTATASPASPLSLSSSSTPTRPSSPTPQPIAAVSPSPHHTPSPEPTLTPLPTSRPTQPTATIPQPTTSQSMTTDQPATSDSMMGYIVFGFIVIGLLGLLISGALRRR